MDLLEQNPSRNIVLCSDGTGNASFKDRGTNVFKLFEALELDDHQRFPELPRQIAYYDDGVGTGSTLPERVLGGAFGYGLKRNVLSLYSRLCETWRPQDKIFLFGFSRGAFTVRTLAHLVCAHGIVAKTECGASDAPPTEAAFQAFLEELWATRFSPPQTPRGRKAEIEFVGVWDTVDAVGIPFEEIADLANMYYQFKFPDHELCAGVRVARQALSIDDQRRTFHPKVWTEPEESDRIRQVWFAGVHSNVGGGYPKQGMSLVALDWMMSEAEQAGLRFVPTDRLAVIERRNVNDKLYDPRAGLASLYRYEPRDVARICAKAGIANPYLHESLFDRLELRPEAYAPGNLPDRFRVETTARREENGNWTRPAPIFQAPSTIPNTLSETAAAVPRIQSGQNSLILTIELIVATILGIAANRWLCWTPSGASILYASSGFTFLVALLFPLSASVNATRQSFAERLVRSGIWSFLGLLAAGNIATFAIAGHFLVIDGTTSFLIRHPQSALAIAATALVVWLLLELAQKRRGSKGPSARIELSKLPCVVAFGCFLPGVLPFAFHLSVLAGSALFVSLQILLFAGGVGLLQRALRNAPPAPNPAKKIREKSENRIWPFLARALPAFLVVAFAPSASAWIFQREGLRPGQIAIAVLLILVALFSIVRIVRGKLALESLRERAADLWLCSRADKPARDVTSG